VASGAGAFGEPTIAVARRRVLNAYSPRPQKAIRSVPLSNLDMRIA